MAAASPQIPAEVQADDVKTDVPVTEAPAATVEQTFIEKMKFSFVNVPIDAENDNAIGTKPFLDAAEELTTMFDLLGNGAVGFTPFTPVKNDILGNVKKLREREKAASDESQTIQDLVRNELKAKKHVATEGLLWLVRGLQFTQIALSQNLANPSVELADSFRSAYAETLKPHHSFLVKPLFSAAMSAVPYRKEFYGKIGTDQDKVSTELRAYLQALEKIVGILKGFQERKEAKW